MTKRGMSPTHIEIDLPAAVGQCRLTVTTAEGTEIAAIRSGWMPVACDPQVQPQEWQHRARSAEPRALAGIPGEVAVDTFAALDCELVRETWRSGDGELAAIRHRFANRGSGDVRLQALLPLRCDGPDSLLIGGEGAAAWDVLVQKRFKNDGPTAFRPGVRDEDLAMAQNPVGPTGEVVEELGDEVTQVRADPFCMLRRRGEPGAPALLLGYLSQTGHLARIVLQFRNEDGDARLEHLTAECELDEVVVGSGQERESQWLMIAAGETNRLIREFADRVGVYHEVEPPAEPPPSVWCSFYAYGGLYDERFFGEDLEDLASRRVPFDVFLIDGGWERKRGDWEALPDLWPGGMKAAAERIAALGYRPALWTAPYVVEKDAPLAQAHPEWMARNRDGELQEYMGGAVLDTTFPEVCDYLEELYRKLTFDWGFHYHKFDFMRGIFNDPAIRFHDPTATRLEAYRLGLQAIRRGAGPDAHLNVCGGHFGGSLGIADSQRSGSDVRGTWEIMKPRMKQNLLRTWMSRLWQVDPDAMPLRRREEPLVEGFMGNYTLGSLTDDEAQVVALNQYLSGQLICLAEKFRYLDEDRRALMRHTFPSANAPAVPLDPFEPVAPSKLVTRIRPRCRNLEPWRTLAVINWDDVPRYMAATLAGEVIEGLAADRFLVSEFFSRDVLGLMAGGETIEVGELAPRSCRVLRIAPWDGSGPVLAGTDLHFSGGGVEIAEWRAEQGKVSGRIDTGWDYPVRIAVAFPRDGGFVPGQTLVEPGQTAFRVQEPD